MADFNINGDAKNVSGFSEADLIIISKLKEMINDTLPSAVPNSNFTAIDINQDPYDSALASILQRHGIINGSVTLDNPDLQIIRDTYETLSEQSRAQIEAYDRYHRDDGATLKENALEAQKLIKRIRASLEVPSPPQGEYDDSNQFTADMDAATAHSLSSYILKMKEQHPELIEDEFDASRLDTKAHDFMNRLVAKQMDEAGIKPENLNANLIHLWVLQENSDKTQASLSQIEQNLAQSASVRDLLGMISESKMPNGSMVRVNTDMSLNGPVLTGTLTQDRFFSAETYGEILNRHQVLASTLFAENQSNPHVEELKMAAQSLGINTQSGLISQEQVGQIAARMLEYHACKLGIDKQDITAAINSGKFMPDLDDLRLVEVGFGLPSSHVREGQNAQDKFEAEFGEGRMDVTSYRNQRWAQEFGSISEEGITERMNTYHSSSNANDAANRAYIRDNYTLPTLNYPVLRAVTGRTEATTYETRRQDYLRENLSKIVNCPPQKPEDQPQGNNVAKNSATPKKDFAQAAVQTANNVADLNAAIKEATGAEAGTVPDDNSVPLTTAPKVENTVAVSQ